MIDDERIADLCKALASPHRVRILRTLIDCCGDACCGDDEALAACVGDLARGLDLVPSTVSHHVKELKHAGLLRCERDGQRIQCSLDLSGLHDLHAFITHLTANQRCAATTAGDTETPS